MQPRSWSGTGRSSEAAEPRSPGGIPLYAEDSGESASYIGDMFTRVATIVVIASVATLGGSAAFASGEANQTTVARIDHVADGDTVALTNGRRVRLVQIDTPEVYFGTECYGPQASATTKRLLRPGTLVRLVVEPATDRVDRYGRLLRYVIRARDNLDVNLRLVTVGAAAPYFYEGRRGRFARRLDLLARRARAHHLGLWKACPGTPYQPTAAVDTGPAR